MTTEGWTLEEEAAFHYHVLTIAAQRTCIHGRSLVAYCHGCHNPPYDPKEKKLGQIAAAIIDLSAKLERLLTAKEKP